MATGGEITLTGLAEGGAIGVDLAVIQGTADGQVKLPAALGDRPKGVTALAAAAAGDAIPIITGGPATVTAGGTIAAGDYVKIKDSTGEVIKVDGESSTTVEVLGKAFTSGVDGDKIDIFVSPFNYIVA